MVNKANTGGEDSCETPEKFAARTRLASKRLDVICAGGRHGGTSILPASKKTIPRETIEGLNATGSLIANRTSTSVRNRELEFPNLLPIQEYSPGKADRFFKDAQLYADTHTVDSAPRLFSQVKLDDLDHFYAQQESVASSVPPEERLELLQKIDLPVFIDIPEEFKATAQPLRSVFAQILSGEGQGVVLNNPEHITPFREEWEEFIADQETKFKPARPFMGLRADTETLMSLMGSEKEVGVDTLVFSRIPSIEQAQHIHRLHVDQMLRNPKSRQIMHEFNEDKPDRLKIGFIDVQGSARVDAGALIAALPHAKYNVDVFLIENATQLKNSDPDALILPGGWHSIQYRLQEVLGLNDSIVKHLHEQRHLLALCAGSIQTRAPDSAVDKVKSQGCTIGTTMGIGKYKVVNNTLKGPHDLRVGLHNLGVDRALPNSKIFRQVPLSNAPYFVGVDTDSMDVIARLVDDERAVDLEEDDGGKIVGLQVRQNKPTDPVRMVAAFHDRIIFRLFLNDLMLWKHAVRSSQKRAQMIDGYYKDEMRM